MASVDAKINVVVTGQSSLDKAFERIKQLDGLIDKVSTNPLDLSFKTATQATKDAKSLLKGTQKEIDKARQELKALDLEWANNNVTLGNAAKRLKEAKLGTIEYAKAQRQLSKIESDQAARRKKLGEIEYDLFELNSRKQRQQKNLTKAETLAPKIRQINELADKYIAVGKSSAQADLSIGQSINTIKSQSSFFRTLADSVDYSSESFRRFTLAAAVVDNQLGKTAQRKFKILAEGLTAGGTVGGFGARYGGLEREFKQLIGSIPNVAPSIAGFTDLRERIASIRDLLPIASREFEEAGLAIQSLDEKLSNISRKKIGGIVQGPAAYKDLIKGPATPVSASPTGVSPTTMAGFNAREKYQKNQLTLARKIDDEYQKMNLVADKISNSILSAAQKEEYLIRLDQSLQALGENRLEDAQLITEEIGKQVTAAERLQKSIKPTNQTFGALGTGFEPISGKLPIQISKAGEKVETFVAGSPAYKQQVEKYKKDLAKEFDLGSIVQEKLKGASERINISAKASSITEQQKNDLLQKAEQARLAIEEKRYAVAKTITAEVDRQRISLERANRSSKIATGGTLKTGQISPIRGEYRVQSGIASSEILQEKLLVLQAKGIPVGKELLAIQNAITFARQDDYQNTLQSIIVLTEANGLAGKRLQLEKEISKTTSAQGKYDSRIAELTEELRLAGEGLKAKKAGIARRAEIDDAIDQLKEYESEQKKAASGAAAQEKRSLSDFDRRLAESQKKSDYAQIIPTQFKELKKLQADYLIAEGRGVQFMQEKAGLTDLLTKKTAENIEPTKQNVELLGRLIKDYRVLLGLRISEAKLAGTYTTTPKKQLTAEKVEEVRKNLLGRALDVQNSFISLEGKGVQLANEKLQIEQLILSVKQLQGKATQDQIEAIAQQILDLKNLGKEARNATAGVGGAGGSKKSKGYESGISAEEARKKLSQIITDFNAAVNANPLSKGNTTGESGDLADDITDTFAQKIKGGAGKMASAASEAFKKVTKAIDRVFGRNSPPKWAIDLANDIVKAFVATLRGDTAQIQSAIKSVFGFDLPEANAREAAQDFVSSFIVELVSNAPSVKAALEKTLNPKLNYEQAAPRPPRAEGPRMELDPNYVASITGQTPTAGSVPQAGLFSAPAPRVGAFGTPFPYQSYNLSTTQFPVDPAIQTELRRNRSSETSRVVLDAIREYRAAVENFWEGEDSAFSGVSRVLASSVRLGAARFARKLKQGKDLSPEQQFEQQFDQVAAQARSAISAGQRSGSFQRFSVGQLGQILQSLSDSVLNSVESLSYTISDAFRNRVSQITNQVDRAVSSGLSGFSGAIERIRGVGGGGNGGGGNGGGGNRGNGGGASEEDLQRFRDFGDLAPLGRATNQQLEILEANLTEVRNTLSRTNPAFDLYTDRLQRVGREQERRAPGASPLTRQFGSRTANAISEGLIGGAFPLLFGQGLGASAFGLAGGAAGGFAGGGLGFGLSLIGTALGTAFDQLSQAAQDTGKALRYPIEGFEKLKEAGLFASKQQEFYIQKLIDSGRSAEAAAVIQSEIASKIGRQGVRDLAKLGKSSDELSKAWAEFSVQLQAALAGPLAGLLNWVTSIIKPFNESGRKEAKTRDVFSSLSPNDQKLFNAEIRNRTSNLANLPTLAAAAQYSQIRRDVTEKFAPKAKPQAPLTGEKTPDQIESDRQKAQQVADEIRQAYRDAFQLQRQGIDLEIQAADNRRKVENDIFAKRQEAARTEADNARTAAQVRIESTDLALRKSFSGAEGEARTILGAVREYIKVRATGEADINKKRRDLEVTMADIQQETSNYIFEQAKTRLQLERSIEDYKRQVSDYQLENQRKIQQLQNVEMAGGAAGGLGAAVQRIGGAWQFRGTSLQKNMRKGDYLSDPRENFFFDFRKDLIPAAQARIKTLSKKDIAALAFTVLTEAGPTDIGKLDVAANLVTRSAGMGNAPISQVAKQPGQYAGVFPYTRAQLESTAEGKRLFGKEYDRVAKLIAGQASDVQMSPIYSRGPTAAQAGNIKEGSRVGYAQPTYQYQQAASQLAPVSPSLDVNTPGMVAAQERLKQLAQDRLKIEQQLSNLGIDAALLGITEAARGESNIIALENELKLEKNRYQAILENSGASANEVAIINQKLAGQAKLSLTKDYELQALQLINDATKKGLITQDESKKLTDAIKEGIKDRLLFLKQEIGLEEEKLRVQQQQESAQRLANVEREIALADIGLKFGYIGEAARAFRQELDISGSVAQAQQFADAVQRLETLPGRQIAAEYDTAATSLQKLATWENVAVTGAKSISEGFGQAFREIAAGTASAQEILAGFFQNLANSFADMASQMIANMIQMLILRQLLGPLFGFNPGGGFGDGLGSAAFGGGLASGSGWGGFAGALAMPKLYGDGGMFADGIKPYADGGMFADGIKPFADGGIVDSPTLFKFADGGALSNGVMGEAGPEAIMPLSRGSDGRLGVEGGGGDVSVTVNVDASGSKVQGDDQKSSQLGRALAAAVREELLKQKRPGGLLQ